MNQYVIDAHVTNGRLELQNIPMKDNTEFRVILIPKPDKPEPKRKALRKEVKTQRKCNGFLYELCVFE